MFFEGSQEEVKEIVNITRCMSKEVHLLSSAIYEQGTSWFFACFEKNESQKPQKPNEFISHWSIILNFNVRDIL